MIGYVTVGTNDLERAAKFYDELLGLLDARRSMEMDRFIAWSAGEHGVGLAAIKPFDGHAATVGNGTMVGLFGGSPEKVKAVYDKALELGGADEGGPGERMPNFYAAYFRDLDGNKLNAFCILQGEE